MPNLTRRSLLVLGGTGAAGLAVAGCGTEDDPREEGSDDAVLATAANAEAILAAAYEASEEGDVGRDFAAASSARVAELERLGRSAADASASGEDGSAGAIDAQNAAIAAYRDCVRLGSTTELRAAGIQFLTQVAAEQAVVRGLEGDDQSPVPFVTGLEDKPYVATDDDDDADEDDETTSTTSTSSSTSTTSTTSTTAADSE